MQQLSDEWFEARKGKITASNVGAILGVSPYADSESVMRSMVREYHGAESEIKSNIAMEWGNDNEHQALMAVESHLGVMVEQCGFIVHENGWLGASPDGLTHDAVIEVKCPYRKEMFSLDSRKDYYAQVQTQMLCAGKTKGYFGVWVPDFIQVTPVELDEEWIASSMPILEKFHSEFLEIVKSKELSAPYLEDFVQDMTGDMDWDSAATEYLRLKADADATDKRLKAAKDELIKMANGRKSKGSGVLVFPVAGRTTTDYARLLSDHPEIDANEYKKTGKGSWGIR